MDLGLKDKVVMLTGANGGLGIAMAKSLLSEGSQLICLVRGGGDRMRELIQWMDSEAPSGRLNCVNVDINDTAETAKAVAEVIDRHKRIDVLINNAGSAVETPFLMMEDGEWDQVVHINLNMTARLTRLVAKQMLRQNRGSIINISSVVSHATGRGVAAYAAAKAGVNRLTEILALELGRKGVRVNAIAPGAIETKMSQPLMVRAGDIVLDRTPLNRIGQPEEVAQAVLFLASEKMSSFITGHILNVDGGICL